MAWTFDSIPIKSKRGAYNAPANATSLAQIGLGANTTQSSGVKSFSPSPAAVSTATTKDSQQVSKKNRTLTNRAHLPQAIVDAVLNDAYSKGDADISVTGLLRPPRLAVLEEIHENDIVEDASERIWALLGQSIHTILERANRTAIAERRLCIEVEGWKVSGSMDVYEEKGILLDYKMTSVWKLIKGDLEEWEKQLNLYSVILRHHGHKVEKLQVITILRDWSKMEAERDLTYPQAQVVNLDIPLWEPERAEKFMRERVILHQQARITLPECTPEDRWARPDSYAVVKKGMKRAVKLHPTYNEAKAHAGFDRNLSVVHRPGASVRCQSYCSVKNFCTQYQSSFAPAARPAEEANVVNEAVDAE